MATTVSTRAVMDWSRDCVLVAAYGFTYREGNGLHDIHMNSGEPEGSPHPNRTNEDGALVCLTGYKYEGGAVQTFNGGGNGPLAGSAKRASPPEAGGIALGW